jgi:type IV secretory pathway TraG/TraD family ATPase VirD4
MDIVRLLDQVKRDLPSVLVGFATYAAIKLGLELFGVITVGFNPFDLLSVLVLGITYLLEKHFPLNPILALAPSLILASLVHDFFGTFIGTEGFVGDVGLGMSFFIGLCSYFVFVTLKKTSDLHKESPKEETGKYPIYLDVAGKYFIPTEFLKYHLEVIGSSGMGKTNILNWIIEQSVRYGLGMFVFDAKSNFNKQLPYFASKYGRLGDLKYLDLADIKRSQSYNPDYKEKADEIFNGLMKSLFYQPEQEPYYRDQASDVLSNLTNLLLMEFPVVTRMDYQNLISNEIRSFKTIQYLSLKYKHTVSGKYFLGKWVEKSATDRDMILSGLTSKLSRFTTREWSPLINTKHPDIVMKDVVEKNQIFLFGTSSLVNQEDAKPLIISALVDLAGVIGKRIPDPPKKPFMIILDEFYAASYPGFNDCLALAREANVCFVLAHHSLGQLAAISPEFKDDILTNTNHKMVMNITEKETVDYFASLFGTKLTKKDVYSYDTRIPQAKGRTEKQDEEYVIHPNYLRDMPRGQAVCRIMYKTGPKIFKMNLKEMKKPPQDFDFISAVPVRNNHLKENEFNEIKILKLVNKEASKPPTPGNQVAAPPPPPPVESSESPIPLDQDAIAGEPEGKAKSAGPAKKKGVKVEAKKPMEDNPL